MSLSAVGGGVEGGRREEEEEEEDGRTQRARSRRGLGRRRDS
jgi:hypothetical protein